MEGEDSSELDDIDRESLVKEIEQIRQALDSHRASSVSIARDEEQASTRCLREDERHDLEDSDDELAIIKSPAYHENEKEETVLKAQRIPVEVISMETGESCKEPVDSSTMGYTEARQLNRDTVVTRQPHYSSVSSASQQNNVFVRPIILEPAEDGEDALRSIILNPADNSEETGGILIPGSSTYPASGSNFTRFSRGQSHRSRPRSTRKDYVNAESCDDDACWESPYSTTNYLFDRSTAESEREEEENAGPVQDVVSKEHEGCEGQHSDVECVEETSEIHRLLNLNRRYQAIIEQELKRTERSLLEYPELQLGLKHMSQSQMTKAEAMAYKHLAFFSKPYFKDKSRQGPPDNEDAKSRKKMGQPHPFEKAPKPWTKPECILLTDAVKCEIIEVKVTPLIQRVEALTPRKSRTDEEEKEMKELTAEVERIKGLELAVLVENHTLPIDWNEIVNTVLPHRTPFQCEIYWYNELHPLLNKGEWTTTEDLKLAKLVEVNGQQDWSKIAFELMTNRSAVQCLRRYQTELNPRFVKSKWDQTDDEKLLEAVRICGVGCWEKVSSLMEGHTGAQCMHRYMKSAKPDIRKGKWDESEDELLRQGIEKFGTNWIKIHYYLIPNRTGSQIRERWSDVLDPSLNRGPWTKEEDMLLSKVVEEHGEGNWAKIADHIPGRNDNRCARRWKLLTNFDNTRQGDYCGTSQLKIRSFVPPRGRPLKTPKLPAVTETPDISLPSASSTTTISTTTTKTTKVQSPQIPHQPPNKPDEDPLNIETSVPQNQTKPITCRTVAEQLNKTRRKGMRCSSRSKKVAKNLRTPSPERPAPRQTRKKRRTEPSPRVVAQASTLPNPLPMAYLTQFSVLLQAFDVDVSGALNNVNSPNQQNRPVDQARPEHSGQLHNGNDIKDLPRGPTPRGAESLTDANSEETKNSSTEECLTHEDGKKSTRKRSLRVFVENVGITSQRKTGALNYSSSKDSPTNGVSGVARSPSSKPDQTATHVFEIGDASVQAGHVQPTELDDVTSRLAGQSNTCELQEQGGVEDPATGVVLSDIRHGLSHDIVLIPDTVNEGAGEGDNPQTPGRRRSSRTRNSRQKTSPTLNKNKAGSASKTKTNAQLKCKPRKVSGERNITDTTANTDNGRTLRTKARTPKKSIGGRSAPRNENNCAWTTSGKRKEDPLLEDNVSTGDIGSVDHRGKLAGSNRDSSIAQNRASIVPPLPPSATTLGAFKRLLRLRVDLQSQANTLKETCEKGTVQSRPTPAQNDETSVTTSSDQTSKTSEKPSSSKTSSRAGGSSGSDERTRGSELHVRHAPRYNVLTQEVQDSLPYQQLTNRFNSLFLWPGFLSIVNPEFVNKKAKQTTSNSAGDTQLQTSTSRKT